jgi:hypothetical protein
MRKLITALAITAAIVVAGSVISRAEAAPVARVGNLLSVTKNGSPLQNVACWCGRYRCACGHPYYGRYGYYGYRRPYRYGY